jgi:hypothetical protein
LQHVNDMNFDAARRRARNSNLRPPIGKFVAGAEGMHAAEREKSASPKSGREEISRPGLR